MADNVAQILDIARKILLDDGISEALLYLRDEESIFPQSLQDDLDALAFRYRELRRADRQGHLTTEDVATRTNKLLTDLQAWLREAAKPAPSNADTSAWPPGLKEELMQHLTFAQLEMAFEKVRLRLSEIPKGERAGFRQLLVRWESFRQDRNRGTLDYATSSQISNSISADLMGLL